MLTFPKITHIPILFMLLFILTGCASTFVDPYTRMQFVFAKGGWYEMGSNKGNDEEKPVHNVCVSDFWIGRYEVKQSEWNKVMGGNPSENRCGDDCPVESISWLEAQQFIQKLNKKSGTSYRLPTEAEWEYAARSGGKDQKWAGISELGNLGDYARLYNNSVSNSNPVGTRKPNGLGIYDMSGNVYEWCQDVYDETYFQSSPPKNPPGPASGEYRVAKGGSGRADVDQVRVSYRFGLHPDEVNRNTGLRLAYTDPQKNDSTCRTVASVYARGGNPEMPTSKGTSLAPVDLEGYWLDQSSGNSSAGIYLSADGKGVWNPSLRENFDSAQNKQLIDLTWSMGKNGNLTINMIQFGAKQILNGHYDADQVAICISRADKKCATVLLPDRKTLKKRRPSIGETGGRYTFTEETVIDVDTGLVWGREGDLAETGYNEYGLDQILSLISKLNSISYGGRNDWRLPRYSEMLTLVESLSGGQPIATFPNDDNIDIRLNDLGFIAVKRDVCYWTADQCPANQYCGINLTTLSSNCSGRKTGFLPVAGQDVRTIGINRRNE